MGHTEAPLRGPDTAPPASDLQPRRGRASRRLELVKTGPNNYLRAIFKAFEFCIPTKSDAVPTGPDWLHEIKYDGLYEASRVKKVFRDQHFFFSAFQ